MERSSDDFPVDRGLPGAAALAGASALCDHLRNRDVDATDLRFRYVEHDPGRALLVLARVAVEGAQHLVAASLGRTAPADDGVQLAWYPNDPALPALATGLPTLEQRLEITVDTGDPLAWVPHRRLVVPAGGTVVKLHAAPSETQLAVEHAARARAAVAVPRVIAVAPDIAAHVQERVDGKPLRRGDVVECAAESASVLHRLRTIDATGLAVHAPTDLLRSCEPVVRLVAFVRAELADRAVAVFDQLARTQPRGIDLVPSHGDFNIGQLLRHVDGSLVVVDTDTLCLAPEAFDLAAYAANLLGGRSGDVAEALDAIDRLCRAYGNRPDGVDWYLAAIALRRIDRAVRRWKSDWRVRTERLLTSAEGLAAQVVT